MSQKSADRIIELFIPSITLVIALATLFLSNADSAYLAEFGTLASPIPHSKPISGKALNDLPADFREILVNDQEVKAYREMLREGGGCAYELLLADNSKVLLYVGKEGIVEVGPEGNSNGGATPVYVLTLPASAAASDSFFFPQFGTFLLLAIVLLFAGLIWSRYRAGSVVEKISGDFKWNPMTKALLDSQNFWNGFFSVFTLSNPADKKIMKMMEVEKSKLQAIEKSISKLDRKLQEKLPDLVTS